MADEATTTPDSETSAVETETVETTEVAEGQQALGDAGKKALDAMKAERNAERQARKALEDQISELRAKVEGREAEHAKAVEAQRVKDEALAAANARILKAEIRAAAAGKLNDPTDALRYIDTSAFEVDADGNVNADDIAAAVSSLIQSKPYLAAQGGRFQGGADGGPRNEDTSKPRQLTRDDMTRMTPEQIAQAEANGQFDQLLGRS